MAEKIFEQMMAKNLTNLMKNIDMHIQQVQQNPSRMHTKKFTLIHTIMKLLKVSANDRILKTGKSNSSYRELISAFVRCAV